MTILDLLERIKSAGIQLWVDGESLRYRSDKAALTPELRESLRQNRHEVVLFLTQASRMRERRRERILRADPALPPQASFEQEGLWLVERLEPGSVLFHVPVALTIAGALDASAASAALAELVARHEVLHCGFRGREALPELVYAVPLGWAPALVDLSELPGPRRSAGLAQIVTSLHRRPFRLEQPPLLRALLLRLEADRHLLALCFHHLVCDGWSLGLLLAEWRALYAGLLEGRPSALPRPAVSYLDYAAHQRANLTAALLERQMNWWRDYLADLVPVSFATDCPRPAQLSYEGANLRFMLAAPVRRAMAQLAEAEQVSLFTLVAAALLALLSRHTGAGDLSLGTAMGHRQRPELEGVVGPCVNLLPLRVRCQSDHGFRLLLARVREAHRLAMEHRDLPFERMVEACRSGTPAGMHPLFNLQLVMTNGLFETLSLPGLTLEPYDWGGGTVARKDLTLHLSEQGDTLLGDLEYHRGLFEAETVQRLAGQLVLLLERVCADPDQPLRALDLIGDQAHALLAKWNDTRTSYPHEHTVHRLFEITSRQYPDRPALRHHGARLTYPELNGRANRLASVLRRHGVRPGDAVGFCLEQSPDRIAVMLAILKLGATYVPLDPRNPEERMRSLLLDTGARLVIAAANRQTLFAATRVEVLELERLLAKLAGERAENPGLPVPANALAYIMYTSGSSGQAKGVAIPHRGIVRLVRNRDYVEISPQDVFLQAASVAFDAATFEIWGALLNGASLALMATHALDDLPAVLAEHGVTVLWLTARLFELMVERHLEALAGVRQLLAGGEALAPAAVSAYLARYPEHRLINGYGPTENTTFTCCALLQRLGLTPRSAPLGGPISNTRVHVCAPDLNLAPLGAVGELLAGGDGLAQGYLNRPGLTAQAFVPDPFAERPGQRLYRTGDLVRWFRPERGQACLEFWGRRDRQVKLRGYRIEPDELARTLERHPSVQAALARLGQVGDEPTLLAYAQVAELDPELGAELRAFLVNRLPSYMVPTDVLLLTSWPLTGNGKIDVAALPLPERSQRGPAPLGAQPASATEELIALIWADLLGLEHCSREDHFFDLGGHSLLANRLVGELMDSFGLELPVRCVFEHPRLAELASYLERARSEVAGQVPPTIEAVPREKEPGVGYPLSFAQERLWFLDRLEPGNAMYSVPVAVRMRGTLFVEVLRGCFNEIVRRHEALRTRFVVHEGVPRQVVEAHLEIALSLVNLSELPREKRERTCMRRMTESAQVPFILEKGPLLRLILYRLEESDHILLMNMHHIVSDGWSLQVLFAEMSALYEAYAKNLASPLPPLALQYLDYAVWQRRWLTGSLRETQFAYWREQLAGMPGVLELPLDFTRPRVQTFRGAGVRFRFTPEESTRFLAMARRQGVTPFMALITVYACLLARYSGQLDLAIGTPIANRSHPGLQRLIGFFLNTLVFRFQLDDAGEMPFRALLARTRRLALDAYAHQELPFEQLVARLQPERDMSRPPLFQAAFSWDSETTDIEVQLPGLVLRHQAIDYRIAKFELSLGMGLYKGRLYGSFGYNRDLFRATTIERLSRHFRRLLRALIERPELAPLELPLLAGRERRALLDELNQTERVLRLSSVRAGFEAAALAHGERIAVSHGERHLRYGQLNRGANRLARKLRSLGVVAGRVVAVCCESSPELVLCQLAALKLGAPFLPLDPGYPSDRLAFMLADSGAALVLTTASVLPILPAAAPATLLVDEDGPAWSAIRQLPSGNLAREELALAPAYLIYTSGSSGMPKGVVLAGQGFANLVDWHLRAFAVRPDDRATKLAQVAFDASVWETWPYLCAGARLIIAPASLLRQPLLLRDWIVAEEITLCFLPTPVAEELLVLDWSERCRLRALLTGGDFLHRFPREGLPFTVYNNYGPTENTVVTSSAAIASPELGQRTPPIGLPIQNTALYLLDRRLRPQLPGVPGELYLAGLGLAHGYHARIALTASAFVPNPFARLDGPAHLGPGSRLYRTGDLARFVCDAQGKVRHLEFLGRIGNQVKLRGFRIELGEIEHHLCAFPGVTDAVALVVALESGDRKLVGFLCVPERADSDEVEIFDIAALREAMAEKLPYYMVPSAFVVLAEFPKTPNGKVDRRALASARHHATEFERRYVPPRNDLEQALTRIWSEVLGLEQVGAQTNFFDLGGHSLLLARVQSRMAETLKLRPEMVELFQFPTIRALVQHLRKREVDLERRERERREQLRRGKRHLEETAIAIVGMSARLPDAPDIAAFWANLCAGHCALRPTAVAASAPDEVAVCAPVAGLDLFDAAFFEMTPREAAATDPQQRLFLEACWHALEHAGHGAPRADRLVGVYAACGPSDYGAQARQAAGAEELSELLGGDPGFMATRVAYRLDLRGPALTVQTACSGSLVAVHLACMALLDGDCDLALAGGAAVSPQQELGYRYRPGSVLSASGVCRAFDREADGTVRGHGLGVVVLRRLGDALRDRDTLYAIIRGSAVNNDGAARAGFTAPSAMGKQAVLREALAVADVCAASIGYLETHGTATPLGDAIELEALHAVFGAGERRAPLQLGALKSAIGHLDAAAGVAGLIKAALCLHHRTLVPNPNHRQPAPALAAMPELAVTALRQPWGEAGELLRAAVSSFGIGGSNAHVVLENAPPAATRQIGPRPQLLLFSARTEAALDLLLANFWAHARAHRPEPGDAALTLALGRKPLEVRAFTLLAADEDWTHVTPHERARVTAEPPALVFAIGDHLPADLDLRPLFEQDPHFAEDLNLCARLLGNLPAQLGAFDLLAALFPKVGAPAASARAQALAELAATWALVRWFLRRGCKPAALLAYGLGEWVAAVLSGTLALADALHCLAAQLSLWQACGSLALDERRLATREPLLRLLANMRLQPPQIPVLSCRLGTWLSHGHASDPGYWAECDSAAPALAQALAALSDRQLDLLLLFAWHQTLPSQRVTMNCSPPAGSGQPALLRILGQLWLRGSAIDWQAHFHDTGCGRVALPVYPFQGRRHWLENSRPPLASEVDLHAVVRALESMGHLAPGSAVTLDYETLASLIAQGDRPAAVAPISWFDRIAAIWRECLGIEQFRPQDQFFDLGGDSLVLAGVAARLRERHGLALTMDQLYDHLVLADLVQLASSTAGGSAMTDEPKPEPNAPLVALSAAQLELWEYERWRPGTTAYLLPFALDWRGPLALAALIGAIRDLLARHPALRTSYHQGEQGPGARVEVVAPPLQIIDLSQIGDAESEASALARREACQPFADLGQPPCRIRLLRLAPEHHLLLLKLHHLGFDGYSLGVLMSQLCTVYAQHRQASGQPPAPVLAAAPAPCPPGGETLLAAAAARLASAPNQVELPFDFAAIQELPHPAGTVGLALPADVVGLLLLRCREWRTTPFVVLLAVWAWLLRRYAAVDDLLIGSPVAGRQTLEQEQAIGYYAQVGVSRHAWDCHQSAAQVCAHVALEVRLMLEQAAVPLRTLVHRLACPHQPGTTPLFQLLFSLENAGQSELALPGVELAFMPLETGSTLFALDLAILQRGDLIHCRLSYRRDAWSEASARRLVEQFAHLIGAWCDQPQTPVLDLPILSESERQRLLVELSGQARPDEVVHIIEQLLARLPHWSERTAIATLKQTVTYGELVASALRIAQFIHQRGAAGKVVATALPRGVDWVTSGLGIWLAGATWLPLDSHLPEKRLEFLLAETRPELLLSVGKPTRPELPWFLLDEDCLTLQAMPAERPLHHLDASLDAYIIYTSGSTGQPKGACVGHAALAAHHAAVIQAFGLVETDVVAQLSAAGFDVAFEETFPTLLSGGTLAPFTRASSLTVGAWLQLAESRAVTVANLPTALWHAWTLELAAGARLPPSLRLCICGTEAADAAALARWRQHAGQIRWINAYGTTETTVTNLVWAADPTAPTGALVPIGRPLLGQRAYVVDTRGQLQGLGLPGELWLGGAAPARGYLGQPALTAERFVPDPFSELPGARVFRTRDRARYDSQGQLLFLGRFDRQLKLRGYRIEPGEIERCLTALPGIERGAVFLAEVDQECMLVAAYAVAAGSAPWSEGALRAQLNRLLPVYMVPTLFRQMVDWPQGASGKTDLRALADHFAECQLARPLAPASDDLEGQVLAVWRELLGRAELSATDDLFQWGAHSLMIGRAQQRLRERFGIDLAWQAFYEYPSCAGQAAHLEHQRWLKHRGDSWEGEELAYI